jgi:hypothetical protein
MDNTTENTERHRAWLERVRSEQLDAIAQVCHEANRAYCNTVGDHSQLPWHEAAEWQRQSSRVGVAAVLDGFIDKPGDAHRSWLREKEKEGWTFGFTKDAEAKTHPCMVPFEMLPLDQQVKDHLFIAVVGALRPRFEANTDV